MKNLKNFFNPKTVAVIGASRNPQKIGHVIFRNFLEEDFKGEVFPINPKADELFGRKCYPSVLDVKKHIDLAIIAVPAEITPKVLEECGKKRISSVIIISGGFKEIGNIELEKKLEKIIKKYKINVIGPNCVGIYDPYSGVDTIFLPKYKLGRPGRGNIAFISQSGALGSVMLDWMAMKNYKLSKFISYGNAVDVDEADLTEYLAKDPKTKVICAYFEGVKEGRKFFEIVKKVSKKKPIIVLKGGITEEGSKAVSSHTGSLAGSYEIYSAVFKQSGVLQAKDLEELFNFARILSQEIMPKGNKVQIITDGGGYGVLTTDALLTQGLKLAKMKKENLNKIKKVSPPHVVLRNPIDLTGDANSERYRVAIEAALEDPGVDIIVVILLIQVPTLDADIVEVVGEAFSRRKKPIIVIAAGGEFVEVLKKSIENFGIPTFSCPQKAAKAIKILYDYSQEKI